MIEFQDVTLSFDEQKIFENLSIKILENQKIALKGKSGSGKTTFLNLILGFVLPDKGKIFINNFELNAKNIRKIRSETGWLPQNFHLNAKKGLDLFNYLFNLKINKKQKPSKEKIREIFDIFALEINLLEKNVSELSGGQKQRILLASVLLTNKKIYLLDEPTSALDEKNAKNVMNYIRNLKSTVIFATHDPEIMKFSDFIFDLDKKIFIKTADYEFESISPER